MISKKKCENCGWYQALDTFGICGREDGRVESDPGFSCKHWCGIKYDRATQKKKDRFELELENREDDEFYLEYYDDDHERWYFEDCWDEYQQKQISI